MNIMKLKELSISYNEDAISVILKIKLQDTLLDMNYAERIKFKERSDMIK